jgi:hypothetical protein
MRPNRGALVIIASLLVQLYPVTRLYPAPAKFANELSPQQSYRAVALPQKDRLALKSIVRISDKGQILVALAAYDDAATSRPLDYLELYNSAGALIVISWFDEFGIERLAIDRALEEQSEELEGVFVLVVTGDSV